MKYFNENELIAESEKLLSEYQKRKSARRFSETEIPLDVIKNGISAAGTAPSGANMQPWTYVVVSDIALKRKIREECEKVEIVFYMKDSTEEWRNDLKQFNTNYSKPFIEEAPYLICIFAKKYDFNSDGSIKKHYYVSESVGIASGFLISSFHQLGLSCLVYTPAPNHFLNELLNRPENEKPYFILAVGYPKEGIEIVKREKKSLDEIMILNSNL